VPPPLPAAAPAPPPPQPDHALPAFSFATCFCSLVLFQGVRLDNVMQNVGKAAFAFNTLQRRMLPKVYRPPRSSIAGNQKVQS